ncbi:MAG: hypothetical protein AB4368_06190 [Xenococcaceae cyanobacterium]
MKLNLSRLVLTAGLSIGIISFASVAEAGLELNGTSLRGRLNRQPQPSQELKKLTGNGSSLRGQSNKQPQLSQQSKGRLLQGESLTGQSTQKQPSQRLKSHDDRTDNSTSLRGQSSSKSQPSQQLKKRCSAVLGVSPMSDCIKKRWHSYNKN